MGPGTRASPPAAQLPDCLPDCPLPHQDVAKVVGTAHFSGEA